MMIYRYYDPASVSVHALCWSIPDRQSGVLLQCCQSVPALQTRSEVRARLRRGTCTRPIYQQHLDRNLVSVCTDIIRIPTPRHRVIGNMRLSLFRPHFFRAGEGKKPQDRPVFALYLCPPRAPHSMPSSLIAMSPAFCEYSSVMPSFS